MDFNSTIDIIIKDLDDARAIIDDLKKYEGVPALQVELAKSKCKSAADIIALLKTMNDIVPAAKEVPTQPQPKPKPQPKPQPQPHPQPQPKVHIAEEKKIPIIADNFASLANTFNDQLVRMNTDKDVTDILKTKQISNLSEAIGVNEKFMFIREVFHNNKDAYFQAISKLDSIESIADARAVIMSYTGDNNENEAVTQLLDLVKRKLSTDE
jgi:hypothetical protein